MLRIDVGLMFPLAIENLGLWVVYGVFASSPSSHFGSEKTKLPDFAGRELEDREEAAAG